MSDVVSGTAPTEPSLPRPLLLTGDPVLLDRMLRLAVTLGVEPEVAHDPGAGRRSWRSAPLVLVGSDRAAEVVRRDLPRRAGTIVVGLDPEDVSVWRHALSLGAEQVVVLPDGEGWLAERLADATEGPRGLGRTVCVVGGRGGAGASTLATALAMTAANRRIPTTLIDGDPLGGGLDLLLGEEHAEGVRWPELADVPGRVDAAAMRRALPRFGPLSLLSWDRGPVLRVPPEAMRVAVATARRGSDLVVVDLPRQHPDPFTEAPLSVGGPVLLVVPADVRSVAAAQRVAAALAEHVADLRVVVRGPSPSELSPHMIAGSLGLPLVGAVRPEPRRTSRQDWGEPPALQRRSPLAGLCARFLDSLALGAAA